MADTQIARLYPDFKPTGIRKEWDHCSIGLHGAGDVMRRHGVSDEGYGNPTDAVGWFLPTRGSLKVLVCDYANGERVTLRKFRGEWKLTFTPILSEIARLQVQP